MDEKRFFNCKICNKIIEYTKYHTNQVSAHLKKHNISQKDYYDIYLKRPDEGICPICHKEAIFINVYNGYRQFCSNRCGGIKPDKIIKPKEPKEPYINPFAKKDVQEKITEYNLKNFGVEHSTQRTDVIQKIKMRRFEHTKEKYQKILTEKGYKITILEHKGNMTRFKCDICNNEYELNFNTFKTRLMRDNINPCPFCKPINVKISEKERKFHQFIKNNYFGNIIENDYKELNGKEIDIYLPDLKLGFEFDGTYWHADPRFYKENDIIEHKKITAGEIWKRRQIKDKLAEDKGIRLIHILEYDWDKNSEIIKENIINILK